MENIPDVYIIIDLFVVLLIGMGPKIALVPFLDLTSTMDLALQKKVARQMVRTAVSTALFLVLFGWLLMRLLHFTPGAASIAGGIVLVLLALNMLVSPARKDHHDHGSDRDPLDLAVYPLGIPYLLNPVGITVLVTASSDIDSWVMLVILIGLVLLVGFIDLLIFSNIKRIAKHLDPSRLVVTEAVFGVLLTALAVQLIVDGLADLGILSDTISH